MAKIENMALYILQDKEKRLKVEIEQSGLAAKEAESDFNKFTNEKRVLESDLKNIQDAIALLSKPKKGKKDEA